MSAFTELEGKIAVHPEWWGMVQERFDGIAAAFGQHADVSS